MCTVVYKDTSQRHTCVWRRRHYSSTVVDITKRHACTIEHARAPSNILHGVITCCRAPSKILHSDTHAPTKILRHRDIFTPSYMFYSQLHVSIASHAGKQPSHNLALRSSQSSWGLTLYYTRAEHWSQGDVDAYRDRVVTHSDNSRDRCCNKIAPRTAHAWHKFTSQLLPRW